MPPLMTKQGGKGARQRTREPGKREIELAKIRSRAETAQIVARGVVYVFCILSCAVPLLALSQVVEPLAGKETVVNANIVISISLMLSVAVNGLQYAKGRSRKGEIERLRAREADLEKHVLGAEKEE